MAQPVRKSVRQNQAMIRSMMAMLKDPRNPDDPTEWILEEGYNLGRNEATIDLGLLKEAMTTGPVMQRYHAVKKRVESLTRLSVNVCGRILEQIHQEMAHMKYFSWEDVTRGYIYHFDPTRPFDAYYAHFYPHVAGKPKGNMYLNVRLLQAWIAHVLQRAHTLQPFLVKRLQGIQAILNRDRGIYTTAQNFVSIMINNYRALIQALYARCQGKLTAPQHREIQMFGQQWQRGKSF